ncbi:jg10915 [Pararge aegeria aegeria]|uniref:Jg10915 protein n=1 Tax=Pararge aegeria aegeria TaxID=348720 RepID=A0A8S4SIR5_9NEOP|nr:jg10915 [Pararge aegeria aegeria]
MLPIRIFRNPFTQSPRVNTLPGKNAFKPAFAFKISRVTVSRVTVEYTQSGKKMLLDTQWVHELPPDKLKIREVVHIDIANDPMSSADYKPETDPTKFKSVKTGRGPLVGANWKSEQNPIMTCYKLVTAEFKWFGLQVRHVFCSIDDWFGMTMADIRAIEDRTKEELEKLRREGEVRGMRADNE